VLNLDVDGGSLSVNGEELTRVALRTDTTPSNVEAVVQASGDAELTLYNGWVGSHDELHAWIGNSGMVVEEDGDRATIRASDGHGEPTFDDLVATVRFTSRDHGRGPSAC
jgi:hypothetical protein